MFRNAVSFITLFVLLGGCVTVKEDNLTLSLDAAIQESAFEITNNLNPGTIIAVLSISSPSALKQQ
jgi:hypothetical protein